MHGLILAGGEGSRLAKDGVETPKALIEVAGTPQLLRLIEQFTRLGCSNLTCMLHDSALEWLRSSDDPRLRAAARDIDRLARVVACRTPSSLHTFVAGLEALPPGAVFATMVDSVMAPADWGSVHHEAVGVLADGAHAALVVTPARDYDDAPLWVAPDAAGRVVAIGPEAASPAARITGGIYAFASEARTRAAAVLASGRHRMRIFLEELVASGADVRAIEVAHVIDIDHRKDLERANAYMTNLSSPATVSERP